MVLLNTLLRLPDFFNRLTVRKKTSNRLTVFT